MPRIASTTRTSDPIYAYDFPVPSSSSFPHPPPLSTETPKYRRPPSTHYPPRHQRHHDFAPPYPHLTYPRPRWETTQCFDADESDEEDVTHDAFLSSVSMSMTPPRRHRDSTSTYRTFGCTYSPPTSVDSEDTAFDDDDVDSPFHEKERGRWSPTLLARRRRKDEERERCLSRIEKVEEDQENEQPAVIEQPEYTCVSHPSFSFQLRSYLYVSDQLVQRVCAVNGRASRLASNFASLERADVSGRRYSVDDTSLSRTHTLTNLLITARPTIFTASWISVFAIYPRSHSTHLAQLQSSDNTDTCIPMQISYILSSHAHFFFLSWHSNALHMDVLRGFFFWHSWSYVVGYEPWFYFCCR